MLALAVEGTTDRGESLGERKDLGGDEQGGGLGADRMPVHALGPGGGEGVRNLAVPGKKKGLAAGDEDLADAELGGLDRDPPHALEAERPPRRLGRGAHAAIVAAQVAVEIGVEPEARADRA